MSKEKNTLEKYEEEMNSIYEDMKRTQGYYRSELFTSQASTDFINWASDKWDINKIWDDCSLREQYTDYIDEEVEFDNFEEHPIIEKMIEENEEEWDRLYELYKKEKYNEIN